MGLRINYEVFSGRVNTRIHTLISTTRKMGLWAVR